MFELTLQLSAMSGGLCAASVPVETLSGPAAGVGPPGLGSAPPGSVSAPEVGSAPAPAPPQQTASRLESSEDGVSVANVMWREQIKASHRKKPHRRVRNARSQNESCRMYISTAAVTFCCFLS